MSGLEILGALAATAQLAGALKKCISESHGLVEFVRREKEVLGELYDEIIDFQKILDAEFSDLRGSNGFAETVEETQDEARQNQSQTTEIENTLKEGLTKNYESILTRCEGINTLLEKICHDLATPKSSTRLVFVLKSKSAYLYWTKKSPIEVLRQKIHFAKMDIVLYQLRALRKGARDGRLFERIEGLEATLERTLNSLKSDKEGRGYDGDESFSSKDPQDVAQLSHTTYKQRLPRWGIPRRASARSIRSTASGDTTGTRRSIYELDLSLGDDGILHSIQAAIRSYHGKGNDSNTAHPIAKAFTKIASRAKKVSDSRRTKKKEKSSSETALQVSGEDNGKSLRFPRPVTEATEATARGELYHSLKTPLSLGQSEVLPVKRGPLPDQVESSGGSSITHDGAAHADDVLRENTATCVLPFLSQWYILLFQDRRNFIQLALISTTLAPNSVPIVCDGYLEAAPGTFVKAFWSRTRLYIVFARLSKGKCIIADAYLQFQDPPPWHFDNDNNPPHDSDSDLGLDADDIPQEVAEPKGPHPAKPDSTQSHGSMRFPEKWEEGALEGRNIEASTSSPVFILLEDGHASLCQNSPLGRIDYYHWYSEPGYGKARPQHAFSDHAPDHWQLYGSQFLEHRCWRRGWFFSREEDMSYFFITRCERRSALVVELISWSAPKLKTLASFWFNEGVNVPFSQVVWDSACIDDYFSEDAHFGIFFSTQDGQLLYADFAFDDATYSQPSYKSPVQSVAPYGTVKSGTRICMLSDRVIFVSQQGRLMCFNLSWEDGEDGRGQWKVGDCSPVLAGGYHPTNLESLSMHDFLSTSATMSERGKWEMKPFIAR